LGPPQTSGERTERTKLRGKIKNKIKNKKIKKLQHVLLVWL
jgi:hypothetical protein